MAQDERDEGLIKMLLDSSHMEPKVPYRQQPYTSQPSTYNTSSTIGSTKVGLPAGGGGRMNPGPGAGSQLGFTTNRTMGGPFSNNQPDYSVRTHQPPQLTLEERLVNLVQMDHSYAKAWRPDTSTTLPTRSILLSASKQESLNLTDDEDYINVDEEVIKPVPQYDPQYARRMMTECEKFVSFANPEFEDDNANSFEETIPKEGWTHQQKVLYGRMIRVLHQDRLARLALEGRDNEPILRRICVDKSAKRTRLILSSFPTLWDIKVVQWLHTVFTEYLPKAYLAAWLDIIQTLRSKVPKLMNKVLAPFLRHTDDKIQQIVADGLALLLRRPWDPAAKSITKSKLEQLPGNPVIIVAPPGPGDTQLIPKRMRLWNNQLGCLGKVFVINIPIPQGEAGLKTTVNQYLQQMATSTLTKVRETKVSHADRPIILMGWGPGASIITHVATIEKVAGLVCLGFPGTTLSGKRGEVGDPLLELKTPTLFVIGDKATDACSDDIEDFRERMHVETGLIVVGSADSHLRVSKRKKRLEGITQTMVDRNLMEEIRTFLVGILTNTGTSRSSHNHQLKINISGSGQESPRKNIDANRKFASGENSGASSPRNPESGFNSANATPKKVAKSRKRNSSALSVDGQTVAPPPTKRQPKERAPRTTQPRPKKPRKQPQQTELPAPGVQQQDQGQYSGAIPGPGAGPVYNNKITSGISLNSRVPLPAGMLVNTDSGSTAAQLGATSTPGISGNNLTVQFKSGTSQGFDGTKFPPGLLSISTPLPQSTLLGQGSTLPPPQIRLPIVPDTSFKPNVSGLFDQPPLASSPAILQTSVGGKYQPMVSQTSSNLQMPRNTIRMATTIQPPKQTPFIRSTTISQRPSMVGVTPGAAGGRYPRPHGPTGISTISITLPVPISELQQQTTGPVNVQASQYSNVIQPSAPSSLGHPGAFVSGRGVQMRGGRGGATRFYAGRPSLPASGGRGQSVGYVGGNTRIQATSNVPILPPGRFTTPIPSSQLPQTQLNNTYSQTNAAGSTKVFQYVAKKSQPVFVSDTQQSADKNISGHPTINMTSHDLPGPSGDQQPQFLSPGTISGLSMQSGSGRSSFITTSQTGTPNQSQTSSYVPVDSTRVGQGPSSNLPSTGQSTVRLPSFDKIQSSLSSKSNNAMSLYNAPAQSMQTSIMKVQQSLGQVQTVASSGNQIQTVSSNQMSPNTISFKSSLPSTNEVAQSQTSGSSSQVNKQIVANTTSGSIQTDSAPAQLNTSSETSTADENSKDDISEIQDVAKILASLSNAVSK